MINTNTYIFKKITKLDNRRMNCIKVYASPNPYVSCIYKNTYHI